MNTSFTLTFVDSCNMMDTMRSVVFALYTIFIILSYTGSLLFMPNTDIINV